jgi:hypothetical protein
VARRAVLRRGSISRFAVCLSHVRQIVFETISVIWRLGRQFDVCWGSSRESGPATKTRRAGDVWGEFVRQE